MNKPMETKKLVAAISLIPESAPFDEAQRAWLNGFFAGMTGIEEMMARSGSASVAQLETAKPEIEEDFPWHDDALAIDERLALAEDRPYERKLMAAMAQLDCGSCGYLCQSYAEAIASGEETNLTLCSPGGKETAKAVKKLVKIGGDSVSAAPATAAPSSAAPGTSRKNPVTAKLIESAKLCGEGSNKDVRHVEIDLSGTGLSYEVGDALGVFPENCQTLVTQILEHCLGDESARAAAATTLATRDLSMANEELCELFDTIVSDGLEKERLQKLKADDDQLDELDVLDFLQLFSDHKVDPDALISTLTELNPRLYSIASSQKAHSDAVHLTVGKVTYEKNSRLRKGVASTFLAERVDAGSDLKVFVQKSHGFTVPANDNDPMIMVGPGTGIAPFVAFLQERQSRGAKGDNWLFFGDQKSETDFLYREQLTSWKSGGQLQRLDTAFSRDQEHKIYVQDRMLENGEELFAWLERGGYFFVCGDASRMAKDVDAALHKIVETHGKMSADEAKAYIKGLKDKGRYSRDVY